MRSLALAILFTLAICIALAVAYLNQSTADENLNALAESLTPGPPTPSPQFEESSFEATPTLAGIPSPQFEVELPPLVSFEATPTLPGIPSPQAESLPTLHAAEEPLRLLVLQKVADVSVIDEVGDVTNASVIWDGSLPGVMAGQSESQPVQVFLSANRSYTVKFRGSGKPALLTINLGPNEAYKPNTFIQYKDIIIPEAVDATFLITPYEIANLRYDADYDGTYETMVEPTLLLEDN